MVTTIGTMPKTKRMNKWRTLERCSHAPYYPIKYKRYGVASRVDHQITAEGTSCRRQPAIQLKREERKPAIARGIRDSLQHIRYHIPALRGIIKVEHLSGLLRCSADRSQRIFFKVFERCPLKIMSCLVCRAAGNFLKLSIAVLRSALFEAKPPVTASFVTRTPSCNIYINIS